MSEGIVTSLDAEELLHLAVVDSQLGHHDEAIKKLKLSLSINSDSAKAHYLLAAEHAEIGLFDRAITEMARAVDLDPKLATAHFQLGLLYFSQDRFDEARSRWSGLDHLDGAESLIAFKNALLHLLEDRFSECIAELTFGIQNNISNPALNRDMQRILGNVQKKLAEHASSSNSSQEDSSKHVLLNTYRDHAEKP